MDKNMREITDIKEIQSIALNILKYIDKVCKENKIRYFLVGGTLLGAIRHKGFIPWDDDIDIFMDYQNYQKFMDCCDKYLDTEKFYFQREDTKELPYFFSKIRMNGTTCISPIDIKNKDFHYGIFVDVFGSW